MNTTGLQIKRIRTLKGMSQEELAIKVGFKAASGISRIENGERKIKSNTIQQIANALNVSPSLLLEEPIVDDTQDKNFANYYEYLPYLKKASKSTLMAVRKLLDMPQAPESTTSGVI